MATLLAVLVNEQLGKFTTPRRSLLSARRSWITKSRSELGSNFTMPKMRTLIIRIIRIIKIIPSLLWLFKVSTELLFPNFSGLPPSSCFFKIVNGTKPSCKTSPFGRTLQLLLPGGLLRTSTIWPLSSDISLGPYALKSIAETNRSAGWSEKLWKEGNRELLCFKNTDQFFRECERV